MWARRRAIGKGDAEVNKAVQALKQHIAFYASTRTYHGVLEHHGWNDLGAELHRLSREGKWTELPKLLTDEMIEEWAIIATFDELAAKLEARCTGIFTTLLLDLPARLRADKDRVQDIVRTLQ